MCPGSRRNPAETLPSSLGAQAFTCPLNEDNSNPLPWANREETSARGRHVGKQTFLEFLRDTLPTLQTEGGREYCRALMRQREAKLQEPGVMLEGDREPRENHEIRMIHRAGAEKGKTIGESVTKG